jgi:hypothetical protein
MNEQRTVTLPLEEYIVMKENAEQLTKAINERKVIYVGSGFGGSWNRYFITDEHTVIEDVKKEAIENKCEYNSVKKKLNELKEANYLTITDAEKRYSELNKSFHEYKYSPLWTRIMRVFNRQY